MDTIHEHKVLVGFKCSPTLQLSLCKQAERMGVSLSSHVEAIVSSYKNKDSEIKELTTKVETLQERIEFYENPLLEELCNRFKGQTITFYDRSDNELTITINDITDVFTIIINSFKINK